MTSPATAPTKTYEFDAAFQTTLAAFVVRDEAFNRQSDGLIKPEYFEDHSEALLVALALEHWAAHKTVAGPAAFVNILKDARTAKRIRDDAWDGVKDKFVELSRLAAAPTFAADRSYAVEQCVKFAKQQAISEALLQSIDLVEKHKFDEIEKAIRAALMVGATLDESKYDFWEHIEARKLNRRDMLAGVIVPDGITTGFKEIDDILYHRGWGRSELTLLMGPAKSGKSMTLVTFGTNASLAGKNVLVITLEVSQRIFADRIDANISDTSMRDLQTHMAMVEDRVKRKRAAGAGELIIHGFPSGSMKPSDLRRLLARYRAQGIVFDLIVVDYADLMQPDRLTNDPIENSRMIYIDLRAIAQEENAALLSATQTNREGFKAAVGKMEHVASDINKVRTVDLLISLNQTEDERAKGEARLFLAASRNQQGNVSIRVKSDITKAKYISAILGIE